ncbi:ribosome-assembly protein 3-domain-containing protein [Leptodontidium sp. MPI-SDFR-AT-0119]|nr:ribosome-assembly protein 3-domain-containing protein [Leptodontidium sp. MPI-SDFR-AT-0119]
MAPKANAKPRRHKKRKSRTEVSSDSSDSEPARKQVKSKSKRKATSAQEVEESSSSAEETTTLSAAASSKEPKDADIEAAFAKFYMQRATAEFADDLERLRTSDDFKDEAVPMLIAALKGGTAMFSMEEKKRIVLAGREKGT